MLNKRWKGNVRRWALESTLLTVLALVVATGADALIVPGGKCAVCAATIDGCTPYLDCFLSREDCKVPVCGEDGLTKVETYTCSTWYQCPDGSLRFCEVQDENGNWVQPTCSYSRQWGCC